MKRSFLFLLLLACAGCITVANSVIPLAPVSRPEERVTAGMNHAMVASIMDARVTVGYEVDQVSGVSRPIEAQSLYSSEIVVMAGKAYEVDQYIVRPPMPGARIAEVNLFPVVYKDGLVVVKGREGLEELRAKK